MSDCERVSVPLHRSTSLRFGLRELLLIMVIVGLGLAWWIDRRRFDTRLELAKLQNRHLNPDALSRPTRNRPAARPEFHPDFPCPFATHAEFVDLLRQGDGNLDEVARSALGVRGRPIGEEAAPAVVGLLSASDARIKARAAIALGYMRVEPAAAVPALILLLDDSSIEVQYHAASALSVLKSEAKPAIPALRNIMSDDDSEIAALAALCISMIDPQQRLGDRFRQLLINKHRKNRLLAVRELRFHLPPDEAEQVLVDAFALEKDAAVRDCIAIALNHIR